MRLRNSFVLVTAAAASTVVASLAFAQATPATSYHVVKTIAAGGEGGWDYLGRERCTSTSKTRAR